MGMISIKTWGSFPTRDKAFGAMASGHAHAVAEAIRFLAEEVLPEAIERDHRLHARGSVPARGYDRPDAEGAA
jgi:hypothetical protein